MTHINGGKYIPPYRKRLADDLLDKAEARETESLEDVLIRLARQKKSGSIVLDAFQTRADVIQHAHQNAVVDTVLVNGGHLK